MSCSVVHLLTALRCPSNSEKCLAPTTSTSIIFVLSTPIDVRWNTRDVRILMQSKNFVKRPSVHVRGHRYGLREFCTSSQGACHATTLHHSLISGCEEFPSLLQWVIARVLPMTIKKRAYGKLAVRDSTRNQITLDSMITVFFFLYCTIAARRHFFLHQLYN